MSRPPKEQPLWPKAYPQGSQTELQDEARRVARAQQLAQIKYDETPRNMREPSDDWLDTTFLYGSDRHLIESPLMKIFFSPENVSYLACNFQTNMKLRTGFDITPPPWWSCVKYMDPVFDYWSTKIAQRGPKLSESLFIMNQDALSRMLDAGMQNITDYVWWQYKLQKPDFEQTWMPKNPGRQIKRNVQTWSKDVDGKCYPSNDENYIDWDIM